ncbi:VanZ family protein [Poriferisphaera sp. WC338]|uniref:VanZ family protein n=1 Tax=Poriferisphaera sp. WC338 TaxID=3425129 RepID=UPI003D8163C2
MTQSTLTTPELALPPSRIAHLRFAIHRIDCFLNRHARILLPLYWVLLAISTHIPKIEILDPNDQTLAIFQPDKAIHVLAFGLLYNLILRARPASAKASLAANALIAFLIAVAYAVVDEYTQSFVDRTVSYTDVAASSIGIIITYIISLAPTPSKPSPAWRVNTARAICIIIAPTLTLMTFLRAGNRIIVWFYTFFKDYQRGLDKDVHFIIALLLTPLLAAAAPLGRRRPKASIIITFLIMGLSAPIIEEIQRNFTRRGFDLADVIAHMKGFFIALCLWAIFVATRSFASTHYRQPIADHYPTIPDPETYLAPKTSKKPVHPDDVSHKHFINHALLVSALTFLSRILGLVRDIVVVRALGGLTVYSSPFVIGFTIPNLFRRLFGEGALTAAFIPHYTRLLKEDPEVARRFASLIIALLTLILITITIASEATLYLVNRSFAFAPETHLALRLTMLMLPYMPLICLVALIGGILQVHHRFGPAAAAPIILNVTMIGFAACASLFNQKTNAFTHDNTAYFIAVSVLLAGVIQVGWQLAALFSVTPPSLIFGGTAKHIRSMFYMMLPMLLGLAVIQINTLFDTLIAYAFSAPDPTVTPTASNTIHALGLSADYPLKPNSTTALYLAQRLYQFPLGVFGIALATAIFPALAHAASVIIKEPPAGTNPDPATIPHHSPLRANATLDSPRANFQTILHHGLQLAIFIGLPAGVGLILIAQPLTRLIFQSAHLTPDDIVRVSHILIGYAISIWAYTAIHVLTRAYYAHKNSSTPLKISVAIVGVNLALNLILIWPFGTAGLAYATATTAILQVCFLTYFLKTYVYRPLDRPVINSFMRTIACTLIMAIPVYLALRYLDPASRSAIGSAVCLAIAICIGIATYLAAALFTRAPELTWLRHRTVASDTTTNISAEESTPMN